jgi:uncharacterized protein involved in outer membrane biogenesis
MKTVWALSIKNHDERRGDMKKLMSFILVFFVIFLVLILLGKNLIAKNAVKGGVKAVTGLEMDIEKMDVGVLNTLIGINRMKLYNPPDYTDRVMIDMPEIYVDYNLSAFLEGKAHLEEVRIDLKELTVVKNRDGKLNIESLNVARKEEEKVKTEEEKKSEMKIDRLDLKIGKVAYKDFSAGPEPAVREYSLDLHETFHNMTDLNEMGRLILVKALMNTDIASLANFDLGSIKSGISDTLMKAVEIGGPAEELGRKAGEALQDTAGEIKKKFKLPFGKKE